NQAVTVNNERRFLSAFFTWMRKEKLIGENPVEATDPLKTVRKPIDYFKPEEMAKMRDACKKPRERALIEVLRSTGARVGELVDITIDQIDWRTGDIVILGEKNDKYQPIFLDDEARYYYRQYLDSRSDDSPYMFPQCREPHEKLSTSGIRSILKTIGNRAKLKCRVYPHKLRKTLGMSLKNKGVDIGTIQEILRHSSPSVTAIYYAQSTPDTLRNVRERCSA
ncbi:MAG: tyrosine-type recombinase/integrase, partial [Lacrimispora sphenoides]